MLAIVTLTVGGLETANLLKDIYDNEVKIYSKPFDNSFKETVEEIFKNHSQILFIMATGIVVRTITPFLKHKSIDPAVLVMDEKAKFCISLLSGHLGGANDLAVEISEKLNDCQAVITTASDVNNLLSVDMFAKKYGLKLLDFKCAKEVTQELVDKKMIGIISDEDFNEINYISYDETVSAVVEISNKIKDFKTSLPYVKLIKKNLVLGIGCRRDTKIDELYSFLNQFLESNGFLKESISLIASAWIKSDEKAIIELAKDLNIEFKTYDKNSILEVESNFSGSEFVKKTLGVKAVSEPCGYLASNKGKRLVSINKYNGMTLSLFEMRGN